MRDVHVIYTDPGDSALGWDISCPQAPELVAGRRTADEAQADTPEILTFAGFAEGTYRLIQHEQKYIESPSGLPFFVRFQVSSGSDEEARAAVVGRELYRVDSGQVDGDIDRMPAAPTGERLVIASVPEDTIGWVLDQLGPGEGTVVAYYAGDDAIYSIPFHDGDLSMQGSAPLEQLGLGRDSTIGEAVDRVMAHESSELRVHVERLAPA